MQRILIIEDEAEVRDMLVNALRLHGFETIEAENGRAGLQLARVYLPDLILSDIRMEGFDGFAALAAIRYQPLTATIPVILMTGQPDEQGRRFAMELGADDYLAKPFTIAGLVTAITVQLKKHAVIRAKALEAKTPKVEVRAEVEPGTDLGLSQLPGGLGGITAPRSAPHDEENGLAYASVSASRTPAGLTETSLTSRFVDSIVETYLRMLNTFHRNLGNTAMRTVALCRGLGELLSLPAEEAQDLCCAAALHDIAMVGLDREAVGRWLRDPHKVTEEEDVFIKQHPVESEKMLEHLPAFKAAGRIIRWHHERWDGTGYPDGLKQHKIPWPARMLSAAIFYCGHHALGISAAKILRSQTGRMFDPEAVEAVLSAASLVKMPRGIREILLNEMKTGQVVAKDIQNATGMVLVHKGRELSDSLIAKIMAINRVTPLDQFVLVYC